MLKSGLCSGAKEKIDEKKKKNVCSIYIGNVPKKKE
jgi:hypothetical protein